MLARACGGFVAFSLALATCGALVAGCRSKPDAAPRVERSASRAAAANGVAASAPAVPSTLATCRALGPAFAVGSGPSGAAHGDDEEAPELPDAVELGEAKSAPGYYAVPGLERSARAGATNTSAFVVVLDDRGRGRRDELVSVSGQTDPPQLAAAGDRLLAVLAEPEGDGVVLRPFALEPRHGGKPRQGPDLAHASPDGFGVALARERALVVYGRKNGPRVELLLRAFDAKALGPLGEPRVVPLADRREPESPRLIPRAGGFHLAWIAGERLSKRPPPRELRDDQAEPADPGGLLEIGPSALDLVALDESGVPVGEPRRLTAPEARVLAYEMASLPDGGILFAYRDERRGVDVERSRLELVWVRADGTRESRAWNAESVGLPSLLADPSSAVPAWGSLALAGEDAARVVALGPALGEELPALGIDVPGGEVLAALAGRFLRSRSHGARVELDVVACPAPRAP